MSFWNRLFGNPRGQSRAAVPQYPLDGGTTQPNLAVITIPGDGDFDTEAVGESNYQEALWRVVRNDTPGERGYHTPAIARLVPEPSNPYDKNAVKVEIDGRLIGYLSREEAVAHAELIKTTIRKSGTATCRALILGGFMKKGRRASLGVWLDLLEVAPPKYMSSNTGRAVAAVNTRQFGLYKNKHYTEYVEDVKTLKRHDALDEALQLLSNLLDAVEEESRETGNGVAPWYYEQYAIVCRKQRDYVAEIAVLERYAGQRQAPGSTPNVLQERLDKARARLEKDSSPA